MSPQIFDVFQRVGPKGPGICEILCLHFIFYAIGDVFENHDILLVHSTSCAIEDVREILPSRTKTASQRLCIYHFASYLLVVMIRDSQEFRKKSVIIL